MQAVEETKEEKQARINAEAQSAANARQRDIDNAKAKAKRAEGDKEVLLYSTFPDLHMNVQSEQIETIRMENNYYRDVTTTKNRHVKFRGFRAKARAGDLPKIRSYHGYGREFMEALDAADGDPVAVSLEKLFATNDVRGHQFCKRMEEKAKRTTLVVMVDEYSLRSEVAALRAKAKS